MLLTALISVPLVGIFIVSALSTYNIASNKDKILKISALFITIIDLVISLIIFILYDNSNKNFQFIQEHYDVGYYEFYLGIDGLSVYFVLLTTLIMPISIISNWKSRIQLYFY
jgi:NADH-ubiquinone oxidoreductase chain 4